MDEIIEMLTKAYNSIGKINCQMTDDNVVSVYQAKTNILAAIGKLKETKEAK